MSPVLNGKAAKVDLVLEEGAVFDPTFHNLADGAVDEGGEHEPFDEYSIAYLTITTERGGTVLLTLGPEDEAGDGICEVDADAGIITCSLPAEASIGLDLGSRRNGYYNLVLYPGGDETQAVRYAEGDLIFSRRATDRPAEVS